MRLLRAADHRRMAWKNGGGETAEIAVSPASASLEALDWRLSMARVASDGPFSTFPSVDRTLAILDGAGLRLTVGRDTRVLTRESAPLAFPADVATDSLLLDGPVTDLNVMTRRGRYAHTVERIALTRPVALDVRGDVVAVLCVDGRIGCDVDGRPAA
ncbi:HutD family protein, partial [bacterium]